MRHPVGIQLLAGETKFLPSVTQGVGGNSLLILASPTTFACCRLGTAVSAPVHQKHLRAKPPSLHSQRSPQCLYTCYILIQYLLNAWVGG